MSKFQTQNFQSDSLLWRLRQSQQQFGEWLEQLMLRPSAPASRPRQSPGLGWEWLQQILLGLVVVGLLSFLGVILWRWGWAWWLKQRENRLVQADIVAGSEPVGVNQLLSEAQQAQRRGDYAQACRALYSAMLQLLNDRAIVPNQLSRTDGEYRRLVQDLPLAIAYQTLIGTHEQIHFGGALVSAEQYQQCQRAYQTIEQQTMRQASTVWPSKSSVQNSPKSSEERP